MSNSPQSSGSGLTFFGKLFSVVLILGLMGLGVWLIMKPKQPSTPVDQPGDARGRTLDTSELTETKTEVPRLDPPQPYVMKDNTLDIELSEYPGYAGLIVANGGLAPNDQSYFATKYGFKVRITLSEEESLSRLNAGKIGASATTADVLAVYGRQYNVVSPAQISYSRGADGIVVTKDIKKINDLKGRTLAAAQFTESDFFIRYLAHEAGLTVKMQADLKAKPDPEAINLVYCTDGLAAGKLFAKALEANSPLLAGCVTWAPATTEIPEQYKDKARLLVTNRNLLIIADILVVNAGFAEKNPDKVSALVDGLLTGNRMVRDNPEKHADLIARAFSKPNEKWDNKKAMAELDKVHLSNLPEQLAFFNGGITQGGSFAGIYQSSFLAYGDELISNPPGFQRFISIDALNKAQASGIYKDQVASLVPVKSPAGRGTVESDPLLSRDLRFYFDAMSDKLDMKSQANLVMLDNIKKMLDVSPGSSVALIGHVDNSNIPNLRNIGGDKLVPEQAIEAVDLSVRRAQEIKTRLIEYAKVDAKRIETNGLGWTKPVSTDGNLNRRVEVQWFTLE